MLQTMLFALLRHGIGDILLDPFAAVCPAPSNVGGVLLNPIAAGCR